MVTLQRTFESSHTPDSIWSLVADFSAPQWIGGSDCIVSVTGDGIGQVRSLSWPSDPAISVHRLDEQDHSLRKQVFTIIKNHNLLMDRARVTVSVAPNNAGGSILAIQIQVQSAPEDYENDVASALSPILQACASQLFELVCEQHPSQQTAAGQPA